MKRKILTVILLAGLTFSMLAGCGQAETANTAETQTEESIAQPEETEEPTTVPAPTEETHTHNYTETITTEASCETDGLKTFTCECGDTYTEPISATGHLYENYVSNNDATYTADGTETATCVCGLTDTRTAEGSKLEYTYTDMEATMYAQQTVNVRDLPSTDGNKVGSLSTNDEVKVTGQADTGWYRIEYNSGVAYVSDSYLGESKVKIHQAPPAQETATSNSCPYTLYQVIDEGGDNVYFYRAWNANNGSNWSNSEYNIDQYWNTFNQCMSIIASRHGWDVNSVDRVGPTKPTSYYIDGYQVLKQEINVIGPDGTITNWNP